MLAMPSKHDWLFSIRTFAAAMLALYIALALGLPRPSWAMGTVYIVSHPLIGAMRSKSAYRVGGTLLGTSAAIFILPPLVDAPILLSLVVALWSGTFLFLSMLDRTPRSYLFRLPAYTMPLIALSSVYAPLQVFDVAMARSQEIVLGIVCASVVAALVFPSRVSGVLDVRIDGWLKDAAAWAAESLLHQGTQTVPGKRHRLAADIVVFDQLITHLAYDSASLGLVQTARELRARMNMIPTLLSSMSDLLATLRQQPSGVSAELARLMADIAAWLGTPPDTEQFAPQGRQLRQQLGNAPTANGWPHLLEGTVRQRLSSLVDLWQDCLTLRQLIAQGKPSTNWQPSYRRWEVSGRARHYDIGLPLFSAGATAIGIFLGCLLWIESGWVEGVNAVILGTVACSLFASLDEPAPLIRELFVINLVCMLLAGILLFVALPTAHEFETLVAYLAIPFLLIGALISQPQFSSLATLLIVFTSTFIGIQNTYNADFLSFINGNLAGTLGILIALLWTVITRPFGTELALSRLLRAGWKDLALIAAGHHDRDYSQLTARMLDRLGLLVPRLAASGHDKLTDGFAELRVGFSTLDLQRDEHRLAEPAQGLIQRVLQAVAAHYQHCADERRALAVPAPLAADIDAAIRATAASEYTAASREALNALVELRVTLFPAAEQPVAAPNPLDPARNLGVSQ